MARLLKSNGEFLDAQTNESEESKEPSIPPLTGIIEEFLARQERRASVGSRPKRLLRSTRPQPSSSISFPI
nr:unnamed protein product [Haemonchus contortus]